MSFPRYPAYKDSGFGWVERIPAQWDCLAGRRLFRQVRELPIDGDVQLSATQKYGVVPQTLFMEMEDQKVALALGGVGNFKRVKENDFVISLRSFQGGIERSKYNGCVSPAYTVLRLTIPCQPAYLAYLLKSPGYVIALQSVTDGIRDGKNISYEQFGVIGLPIPSLDEQQAIATFLDHETAKIDALVAEQERLIELLKEKRQAVISHAVTKGLDPSVPMKDSGVEWLGEVPAHWEVAQFRRYIAIAEGQVNPEESPYSSMVLIAPNHVESSTGRVVSLETAAEQGAESGKYLCAKNDVIYSKIRPALRKVCIAPVDCLCSADMYPLKPHGGLTSEFLLWYMLSDEFSTLAVLESERVAMPKINRETLNPVAIVVPPEGEQREISSHLSAATEDFDRLVTEATAAIELLQERRTALISAAVTGQIDVRDWVPAETVA